MIGIKRNIGRTALNELAPPDMAFAIVGTGAIIHENQHRIALFERLQINPKLVDQFLDWFVDRIGGCHFEVDALFVRVLARLQPTNSNSAHRTGATSA